jgi:hypothetical protein
LLAAPAAAAAIDPETSDVSVGAIATVPGSRAGTYATPVVVIERGADLSFVNTEPFPHDVRSVAMGPDDVSWCEPYDRDEPAHAKRNPRQFPKGKCPLLWSPAIAMTTGAVETKVHGTKNLKPGTSVEFYCTNFPDMRGTVVVR